jgi:hypothetical protein
VLVVRCDRFAELRQPERRGICGLAVAQRAHAGLDHRRGRGEVGLADLHVHDVPALRLERVRARKHVHHLEGLDLFGAARHGFWHEGRGL